jgi:hypothetical protein
MRTIPELSLVMARWAAVARFWMVTVAFGTIAPEESNSFDFEIAGDLREHPWAEYEGHKRIATLGVEHTDPLFLKPGDRIMTPCNKSGDAVNSAIISFIVATDGGPTLSKKGGNTGFFPARVANSTMRSGACTYFELDATTLTGFVGSARFAISSFSTTDFASSHPRSLLDTRERK